MFLFCVTLLTEPLQLATEVNQSMATILPEKFDHGDFPAWLRQFECCASANKWNDEDKAVKLPAFLRGVAATHFHALTDTQKDSYDHLIENLKAALCPAVCKEMFYADFTARLLHDKEDPAVYLHSLRELLDKADPTLSAAAKEALLGRQFLTGLPATMKLKLLEHNPTPTLAEMVSICKQLLAIRLVAGDAPSTPLCAAAASIEPIPNVAPQFSAVQELKTAVKELQIQQKAVVAALSTKPRPNSKGVRCFFCAEMGHIARNCPYKSHGPSPSSTGQPVGFAKPPQGRRQAMKCTLCGGQGHYPQQCANNWTLDNVPPNYANSEVSVPLNY